MSDNKSKNGVIIAIVALIFVGLLAALFFVSPPVQEEGAVATAEGEAASDETVAEAPAVSIDLDAALSDRIVGDINAPVRIAEYASLSCSHCAEFHKNTYAQVKANYIDTGKAYFVFSDFPLDGPALLGSMIARCLPADKYFDFISDLFNTQEVWARTPQYKDQLKNKAVAAGMSSETFEACANNADLENALKNRMRSVQQQWNISATPSFVLNNKTTVSGAFAYEDFAKMLDQEAAAPAEISTETPAAEQPAGEEATDESVQESVEEEVAPAPDEAGTAE